MRLSQGGAHLFILFSNTAFFHNAFCCQNRNLLISYMQFLYYCRKTKTTLLQKNTHMRTAETQKRIIILGAGIGGLYIAGRLQGFSIDIYEKKQRNELGYPWADSVDKDTFKKAKITLPEDAYTSKQVLKFYSPSGYGYISQAQKASKNLDVDRKKLIEYLLTLAEQNSDIHFGVEADSLIVENDKVIGVTIDGKAEYCDLVIDSSGIFSKYRFQVPGKFQMGDELCPHDYLMAYRGFYRKTDNTPASSNVYLMPDGFSVLWCKDADDPAISDIFVSNFTSLTNEQIESACDYMQEFNPHVTKDCLHFATDAIPVRYPLSTIVADGYAIVGNAAFMTKPTSGSGIENTLVAAAILADVIKKATSFTAAALWQYAVKVNNAFGANCYMSYIARSRFQVLDREDLIWLFDSGILNESLLAIARFDVRHQEDFQFRNVLDSLSLAKSRPAFIKKIIAILRKCVRGKIIASRMPRSYDEATIAKWKAEYDRYARKE